MDRTGSFAFGTDPFAATTALGSGSEELLEQIRQKDQQVAQLEAKLRDASQKVALLEADLLETQTNMAIDSQKHLELEKAVSKMREAHELRVVDLKDQLQASSERLRAAPLVDDGMLALYFELRTQIADKLNGPALTKQEKDISQKLAPLALLDRLRMWTRKLLFHITAPPDRSLGQTFANVSSQLMRELNSTQSFSPNPNASFRATMKGDKTSMGRTVTLDPSLIPPSPGKGDSSPDPSTPENSMAMAKIAELMNEVEELQERNETLAKALAATQLESQQAQEHFKTLADLARRDAANAKLESRKKEARIEKLTQEVANRKELAAEHQSLLRSQREAIEGRKNMKIALEAKQQEIAQIRRNHEDDMREVKAKLNLLERQKTDTSRVESELLETKERAEAIRGQLVRSNVKSLIDDRRRATDLAKKQQEKIVELECKLSNQEGIMQHLDSTNKKMTEQYTAIFEAHVREKQQEQQRRARARTSTIGKATKGPNSELNVEFYRSRYQEVLQELKMTQRKMKQLLLFAHHDHLAYSKHTTATEAALAEAEEDRDILMMRSFDLMQAVDVSQTAAFEANRRARQLMEQDEDKVLGEKEDASVTLVTPSIRIQPSETVVDMSVPSLGESRTPFGGPLDESEILRLRTHVPTADEPSMRSLAELNTPEPPEGTTQVVLNRRPQRRTPGTGSTRGRKFDFKTVGSAKMNTSALHSLVRPASADLSMLRPSSRNSDATMSFISDRTPQRQRLGSGTPVSRV